MRTISASISLAGSQLGQPRHVSGSIDPGILTYLMRERHLTGQELDELLNTKSGLLGIQRISDRLKNGQRMTISQSVIPTEK